MTELFLVLLSQSIKYKIRFGSLTLTYGTLDVTSYPDSILEILVLNTYFMPPVGPILEEEYKK